MSNRTFPSTVQSLIREGKILGLSIAPQGSSAPLIVSGQGLASIARNSAGNFTFTLQNQFRSLVAALAGVQLATSGEAQAKLKVGTTNSITVTAGADYPGAEGNAIHLVILAGTGTLGVTTDGTTITIQLDTGGSTPAAIQTAFNAAIAAGMASITAITGSAAITAALGTTPLAGGNSGGTLEAVIQSANVTGAGTGPQTVTIQVQDMAGNATDIAANAGNLLNLFLFVKSSGVAYPAGGVQ